MSVQSLYSIFLFNSGELRTESSLRHPCMPCHIWLKMKHRYSLDGAGDIMKLIWMDGVGCYISLWLVSDLCSTHCHSWDLISVFALDSNLILWFTSSGVKSFRFKAIGGLGMDQPFFYILFKGYLAIWLVVSEITI